MDLNNLSLQELKTLQGDVDVAIHNFEKRKKAISRNVRRQKR